MIEILPNWHPIFVHFTVALFSISVLLYVVSLVLTKGPFKTQLLGVANWNLWMGGIFTIVTLIMGWLAYNSVVHDTPSHVQMTTHMYWAFGAGGMFALVILWSLLLKMKKVQPGILFILVAVGAGGVLAVTAYHGGEAVYRFGLGVKCVPNQKCAPQPKGGHTHSHAPGQGHGDKKKGKGETKTGGDGHSHGAKTDAKPKSSGDGHSHGEPPTMKSGADGKADAGGKAGADGKAGENGGHSQDGHAH